MKLSQERIIAFQNYTDRRGLNECWNWAMSLNTWGYGAFGTNGKQFAAHRIAWIIAYGDIPEGLHVLHKCDNRRCVNPSHLFLGTHKDNMKDKGAKGRTNGYKKQEFCSRGHSNWITLSSGMRQCLPCRRQRSKAFRQRRKLHNGLSRKTV